MRNEQIKRMAAMMAEYDELQAKRNEIKNQIEELERKARAIKAEQQHKGDLLAKLGNITTNNSYYEYQCKVKKMIESYKGQEITEEVKAKIKAEKDKIYDECFEIVKSHFNSYGYVDDPENYTFTEDHYFGNKQMGYWFVFTRVIDGIKTCDDIKIFISSYGEIYAYHALMLGTMKNVDISSLNFAELESAVEKKLKTIYSKYPDMTYTSDNVVLTRLADGSFAFEYDTTVSVTNEDGAECSEYCYFVIKID
jgi:hypothetical protein